MSKWPSFGESLMECIGLRKFHDKLNLAFQCNPSYHSRMGWMEHRFVDSKSKICIGEGSGHVSIHSQGRDGARTLPDCI